MDLEQVNLDRIKTDLRTRREELERQIKPLMEEYLEVSRMLGEPSRLSGAGSGGRSRAASGRAPRAKR